jgi:hypothetical protein
MTPATEALSSVFVPTSQVSIPCIVTCCRPCRGQDARLWTWHRPRTYTTQPWSCRSSPTHSSGRRCWTYSPTPGPDRLPPPGAWPQPLPTGSSSPPEPQEGLEPLPWEQEQGQPLGLEPLPWGPEQPQELEPLPWKQPEQLPPEQPHTTPSRPGVHDKPPVCWRPSNKFHPCTDRWIRQVPEPRPPAPPKAPSQPLSNELMSS